MRAYLVLLLFFSFCISAMADYGWLPKPETLHMRLGLEYYYSSSNFDLDSFSSDIVFSGRPVDVSEIRVWLEPEYGISQDWSAYAKIGYTQATLSDLDLGESVLTTGGLRDFWLGTKWNFYQGAPNLTFEALIKLPSFSNTNLLADDFILGDGNVDLGLTIHSGFRFKQLFFNLSPGFLWRLGGYSSAFTFRGAVGARIKKFYGLVFTDALLSIEDLELFPPAPNSSGPPGSGGAFSRLSGAPKYFEFGPKVGYNIADGYFIEGVFTYRPWGQRVDHFYSIGFNFFAAFSFSEEEKKTRLKEIPLDSQEYKF